MKDSLVYRFKFYFDDGTSRLSSCKSENVLGLFLDFEGLMDMDTYKSFDKKKLNEEQILLLAKECYPNLYAFRNKKIIKIEIINTETNEIIDKITC